MINGKSTLSIKVVCIAKTLFTTKITKNLKKKLYEFSFSLRKLRVLLGLFPVWLQIIQKN